MYISAEKRQKQNLKRRHRNRILKASIKTVLRSTVDAVDANDKEKAKAKLLESIKKLDAAVTKGIFHKNKVARKKSRMHHLINKMK